MGFLSRGISKPPVIVRSCYDPEGPQHDFRSRLLYQFGTEGMVVINEQSKQTAIARNGFSPETVQVIEPGIDLDRFSPQRKISEDPHSFGLKPDSFVVGVVSRIRDSRRLDISLKAIAAACQSVSAVADAAGRTRTRRGCGKGRGKAGAGNGHSG